MQRKEKEKKEKRKKHEKGKNTEEVKKGAYKINGRRVHFWHHFVDHIKREKAIHMSTIWPPNIFMHTKQRSVFKGYIYIYIYIYNRKR